MTMEIIKMALDAYKAIQSDEPLAIVTIECLEELIKLKDATRWIPCSERLPEKNGQYICTTTGNKVRVLGFSQNPHKLDSYDFLKNEKPCFYFYDSEWGYVKVDCVYAWMPLPEPYREEQNE